jgi:hypothetical protein
MKWKGRRQSKNIEDRRPHPARKALEGIDNRNRRREYWKKFDKMLKERGDVTLSKKDIKKIQDRYKPKVKKK